LNLYGYVGNNPVNKIDPLGLYNPISGPGGAVGPGSGLADPSLYLHLPPMPSAPSTGASEGGNAFELLSQVAGYGGIGLTAGEFGPAAGVSIGSNLKPYWNGWGGNGSVCTVKIGELAHDLGPLGFYAGTAGDSLRWFNGDPDISGGKVWLNATMGAIAWKGGPLGGAAGGLYFLFDGDAGEHLHDFPIYSIPAL
jgi:hypothetical protein